VWALSDLSSSSASEAAPSAVSNSQHPAYSSIRTRISFSISFSSCLWFSVRAMDSFMGEYIHAHGHYERALYRPACALLKVYYVPEPDFLPPRPSPSHLTSEFVSNKTDFCSPALLYTSVTSGFITPHGPVASCQNSFPAAAE